MTKTNEQFIKQVYDLTGDEYGFLEEYQGAKEKIKVRHNSEKCYFNEYYVSPSNFLKNRRCPKCKSIRQGESSKKTNKEFLKEVYDLVGDEYTFLEKYKGAKISIGCTHNECGHKWKIQPSNFLTGARCKRCFGNELKTNSQFLREVYKKTKEEYFFLEEYINAKTEILVKHKTCGYIYKVPPSSFLSGSRCISCSVSAKKTNEIFLKKVYDLVKDEYLFLEEYENSKTKIKCRHNICGYVYSVAPSTFLQGFGCQKCAGNGLKGNDIFEKEVYNLVGNEYLFLQHYKNTKTKILCRHNECGHEWKIQPNSFLRGTRCPNCTVSKGEFSIIEYLSNNDIKFKAQFKTDKCKYKYNLPFDFAILSKEEKVKLLIEYDGEQHYKPIKHFGGEETFEIQKTRDNIKNTYCKENNIPLLRIPYWDYDRIEEILEEELTKLNLINV